MHNRPYGPRAGLASLLAALACALLAAPALASKTTVNTLGDASTGTTGGLFNTPRGVAVNQTGNGGVPAGTTYIVDAVNRRVQRFSPTGAFVSTWGRDVDLGGGTGFEVCTVAASCKRGAPGQGPGHFGDPTGIAIDQANGNVYVADQNPNNLRINVLSATGAFYGAFGFGTIDGASEFQFCTTLTGCRSSSSSGLGRGGEFGSPFEFGDAIGGLAVDAAHNVYVADKTNRRVDVFAPTFTGNAVTGASFVRAFGWDVVSGNAETGFEVCTVSSDCKQGTEGTELGQFGGSNASPSDVAVDSSGSLYALDFTNNRIQRFDSTATPTTATFGSAALSFAFGTGNLLNLAVDTTDDHLYVSGASSIFAGNVSVAELDPAGASVDTHGTDLTTLNALGLAVAPVSLGGNLYLSSNNGGHRVYVLNEPPTIDPVTVHTGTTATFSGDVVSNGLAVSYHFEYSTDGANWTSFPTPDADAGSAPGTIPVSQDVSGLIGSQPYRVRLVQNRPLGGGSLTSAETSFTTDPAAPAISAPRFADLASTAATLNASINPQHQATSYHFEYTDAADFEANAWANARRAPAANAFAGSGGVPVAVAQHITGLEPATTYHFRAVATNPTGTTEGPERTFKTLAPGSEDCPNAAFRTGPSAHLPDCRAYELVTPADTNGSTPFARSLGEGDGDGGFETALVSPTGDSAIFQNRGSLPGFEGAGGNEVYRASRGPGGWSTSTLNPSGAQSEQPLPGGVSPDHGYSFWSATNGGSLVIGDRSSVARYIRDPAGNFELIGRGSLADDPEAWGRLITASAGHIVFTSQLQLEPDAPAEVGPGDPMQNADRVAAVYDRTPGGPTRVVSLLPGDVTPAPGTTTYYRGVAADGSAVVFSVDNTMYVRRNNATTVAVASAASPHELAYAGVSPGGDRVLYLKPDVTSTPAVGQIFTFDADTQATTQITGGGAQVVNISTDGSHVYFVSPQQLDGDKGFAGAENLYVWDGSGVRFIAVLEPVDVDDTASNFALGAWTNANGATKNGTAGLGRDPSRTTPDGSVFVFVSRARLTAYDNAGYAQVYRYDADADQLDCVSCSPSGDPASYDATFGSENTRVVKPLMPVASLSADGESVYFESSDALAPGDTNSPCDLVPAGVNQFVSPCRDVYQWKDGNLSLISSGRSSRASSLWAVSPDGRDVLVLTADPLVPRDPVGGEPSVYDARVGGGFPADQVSPPCVEDACQGEADVPPALPTIATVAFAGLGHPATGRPGKVTVTRPKAVTGFAAKLRVKVPNPGRITVSGKSIVKATKRASRAGTLTLRVRLKARGRRTVMRRGMLKVPLRVRYRPATGSASVARVLVTFKEPKKRQGKKGHARANTTRSAGQ